MPSKRMLIDAAHPEETRVVVVEGSRLEEYDVEVASRRQLKGNIYLAKITRVEPSLQAAFVDYGGNRHGFLAFNEIHPDYYQIPVADRERLLAEEAAMVREAEARAAAEEGEEGEGGIDEDDDLERRQLRHPSRHYKIQEVIKRRQIMLVQVAKEERGNKGAALTTYLSLAGRYCVLMPNTARGGGISRKITNASDRKRLKKILVDLEVPEGMAVIVRTAGAGRSKAEIKRDYEYLMRLWGSIRENTLSSTAPALVYEEGSLIKRSIRDHYERDIEEILIQGEPEYKIAREFMKLFIPSHAKRVKLYEETERPLLQACNVEDQLDAMHNPVVQLRSGGYLVINPTEALVTIDVNSGRATRERHIEETALRTNLEASDEIARQLRLRDLAGLIVIDFIDMEVPRNQGLVERRIKDAMKGDRARTQIGRISPFGLLELSRQRLRPSLLETSFEICAHCRGSGVRRSTESTALVVLRKIEEEGSKHRAAEINVAMPTSVAMYLLNHKRRSLLTVEERFDLVVSISADDSLIPPDCRIERLRPAIGRGEELAEAAEEVAVEEPVEAAVEKDDGGKRGRRRRGRRRRRPEDDVAHAEAVAVGEADVELDPAEDEFVDDEAIEDDEDMLVAETGGEAEDEADALQSSDPGKKRRRRGKRGGRRRSRRGGERDAALPAGEVDAPAIGIDDGLMVALTDSESAADESDDPFDASWMMEEHGDDAGPIDLIAVDTDPADGDGAEAVDTTEGAEAPAAKRTRTRRKSARPRKSAEASEVEETGALAETSAEVVGEDTVAEPAASVFVPDYRDRAVTGEGTTEVAAQDLPPPATAADATEQPAEPSAAAFWVAEATQTEASATEVPETEAPGTEAPDTEAQASDVPAFEQSEAEPQAFEPVDFAPPVAETVAEAVPQLVPAEPVAEDVPERVVDVEPPALVPMNDADVAIAVEESGIDVAAAPALPSAPADEQPVAEDVSTWMPAPAEEPTPEADAMGVAEVAVETVPIDEPAIAAEIEPVPDAAGEPVSEPAMATAGLDVAALMPSVAPALGVVGNDEVMVAEAEAQVAQDGTVAEDLRRTEVVHVGENGNADPGESRRGWWSRFLT